MIEQLIGDVRICVIAQIPQEQRKVNNYLKAKAV